MTLPKLLATFAAGAAATAVLVGPPVAKLVQILEHKNPHIEQIRSIYEGVARLTEEEP